MPSGRAPRRPPQVEQRPPRAVSKAKLSDDGEGCSDASTAWAEACDVDEGGAAPETLAPPAEETFDEFVQGALSRGGWLVGLLAAQSLSSIVLEANEVVGSRAHHRLLGGRGRPPRPYLRSSRGTRSSSSS